MIMMMILKTIVIVILVHNYNPFLFLQAHFHWGSKNEQGSFFNIWRERI